MGAFGEHPGSVHGQLMRAYASGCQLPQPEGVPVVAADRRGGDVDSTLVAADAAVIYPHDWVAALANHYPSEFD
eukprot:3406299-Alexandrium_andersonii.AAC.1